MPRVTINATQKCRYSRTFEMSEEDFAKYQAACERNERDKWFHNFAEMHLDPLRDEPDYDNFDDVYVEPVK